MKNYTKITSKFIEDIQSNVTIYKHNKTNARICTIENDDTNKVFSIAFRTPPKDSTGLTHILEHSVLCGSKNYPVKDPFVELLKSSLNTFLNAFTFPDKTMYPAASQNDKDFKNLMSVYMDAVFYPQIYNHEEIFMQEGWHYHILDENEPITYNGVVYNEMKGAFSDPQQTLFRHLMHSLYPDTAYGFESGGNPVNIPELTYEDFKEFHSKYYHPTNSYIFIYGNCDMEERMNWLDEAYLSNFDKIEFDTEIKLQAPFDKPVYEKHYSGISPEQSLDNKTYLSYNCALPTTLDTKLTIATSVLVDVLFNTPGAPLKQALIDAKLGDDVMAMLDESLIQPLLSIIVVNSNEEKLEEFISIVNNSLNEILDKGLDHEALKALISFAEFKVREGKFGRMPKGLEIQMTSLSSWLYDEADPFSKLENIKYYQELKNDLETNYFENIITKYILNNNHKSYVMLAPSHTYQAEKEEKVVKHLEAYKNSLSKEEVLKLIEKNKALAVYQSTPSTPEEVATLPKLALEDLNPNPEKYNCVKLDGKYDTLYSDYFTNGIHYVTYSFIVDSIDKESAQYLKLLSMLLSNVNTKNSSYAEVHKNIQSLTGGVSFASSQYLTCDNVCKTKFDISFSAVEENLAAANEIVLDVLHNTNLDDYKRIMEKLAESKVSLEMTIVNAGHAMSLLRAGSYITEANYLNDATTGLGFYDFLCDLINNFDSKKELLTHKLEELLNKVFTKNNFLLRFTGNNENLENAYVVANKFFDTLSEEVCEFKSSFVPNTLNEAVKTPADVNYVARVGLYDEPFSGAMHVLNNALSLDYLWMQVRVHGGAYGCMIQTPKNGLIGFTSYRDPEIARTNKVYEEVVDYIRNLNPTDEELLKYKIGAIGSLDQVLHASSKGNLAQNNYLAGFTYELQAKYRKEAIEATKEDLVNLAQCFEQALSTKNICVIGNQNKIEANKELFDNIRNLTL